MRRITLVAAAISIAATPVTAQVTASGGLRKPGASAAAQAVAQVSSPVAVKLMPENTLLQLTPMQEISSKHVEEGQEVAFATVGDVTEGASVVIPRGSPVTGLITWKTGRAIGGKSGKFEVTFKSVRVRGKSYPMSGSYRQEGRGNTVGALLGAIVISGRSAVMLPGQIVNGFTAAPIPYEI